MKSNYTFSILLSFLIAFNSLAQPTVNYNAARIQEAIKKLNVLGSVLYIAAHPDDENTKLITYFVNEKLYNTAYLSLTRGDGGQNLIGHELNELLGVIRTQELLAARRVDGGKQYFSRAKDFGFSKNPDETFEVWDHDKVLADMVWVIRKFRPDVMVTRFNTEPGRTHGHHTASAILAEEAFTAAADPNRFPEQLKYVQTWQAKRLLWNTNSWFYVKPEDFKVDSMIKIDVGSYNEALGESYTEIAAKSRSMHKSQGFGASGTRGESLEYLEHTKGPKAKADIFEDINTTWNRIEGGDRIAKALEKVYKEYSIENPSASLSGLLEVRKFISELPDSYWKQVKLQEIEQVITACAGLWIETVSEDYSAVPGQTIKVTTELVNRSKTPITVNKISFAPSVKDTSMNLTLKDNADVMLTTKLTIPLSSTVSQPYWLRTDGATGMFTVEDQLLIGLPENPNAIETVVSLTIQGQTLDVKTPLVYKKTDPVKGERYRPFIITPPVFINPSEDLFMFADNKPKMVTINLKSGVDIADGTLSVSVPEGWKSEPTSLPFSIKGKGKEQSFMVKIFPSTTPMQGNVEIKAVMSNNSYNQGLLSIDYEHIPAQTLFPKAIVKVNRLDLKKKGENIGYIMGAGDEVPEALRQIGYNVTILNDRNISLETLNKFDAVITGIRAFNTTEKLKVVHPTLLNYVKNGGTLIVQYNTMPNRITADAFVTDSIGPYPFKISRDRVTKEDATARFLNPQSPLLNSPNKITEKDFEGWVQERGLYFPNEWSKEYQTLISFNDPNETPKDGSILYAKYGKGVFIYTSLSWFRELPSGVTGAYRLFVNLISAGK